MKAINELIVVKVTQFSGTTSANKNSVMPVMMQCLAGKMPNKNTVDGTVAFRAGFEVGKTYLAQVRERGFDLVYGRDFTWIPLQELSALETIKARVELGLPEIIDVLKDRPEGYESTVKRQSDAIESLQTKRIKEGNYIPAYPTTAVNHQTASEVIQGTSITTSNQEQTNLTPEDLKVTEESKERNKLAEKQQNNLRRLRQKYYGEHTSQHQGTEPVEKDAGTAD